MFQRGDKIFYHPSVHLELGIGWVHLELAGVVVDTDEEQVKIVDKFGQVRRVEDTALTPRPDDANVWYSIDDQPLPE